MSPNSSCGAKVKTGTTFLGNRDENRVRWWVVEKKTLYIVVAFNI